MIPLLLLALLLLLGALTLGAYVSGIYEFRGKLIAREFQDNIDAWEELVEPRLGMPRDRIALSADVVRELALGGIALVLAGISWHGGHEGLAQVIQVALGFILAMLFFSRFIPYVLFTRTSGRWIANHVIPIRLVFYLVLPITLLLGFALSVASLAETGNKPVEAEAAAAESVEALIEAGREEGILEEHDSELVRSAVEFGDKIVREVMTPRPGMFAVSGSMTIEQFTEELKDQAYSRVPVYNGSLDHITGIAFAHDILQITDADARSQRVSSMQRPASFVPETKHVNQLLREMQREKQHMSIVIDEYGSVAGLVTIEDLLEEIVGDISDEHDAPEAFAPDAAGAFVVPGNFEVDRLEEFWPESDLQLPEETSATTLGGLVSELAGRIPLTGEVVPVGNLRVEVLEATGRRVEKLRISREDSGV